MAIDDEKLNVLIRQIYDAALDDACWPKAVHTLTRYVGAADSCLFTPRIAEESHSFTLSPFMNAGEELTWEYEAHYWRHDVWMNQGLKMGSVKNGNIVHGDQLIERRNFLQTEFYGDFIRPKHDGLGVLMSGIVFDHSTPEHSPPMVMGFYKKASAAAFTPSNERLLRTLMPHFQQSLRIRRQFQAEKEARELREEALGQVNSAIVILNQRGQIVFSNPLAESLLKKGNGLFVRNGYLTSHRAHHHNAIHQAITQAVAGIGSTVRLENVPPYRTCVATFSPVTASRGESLKLRPVSSCCSANRTILLRAILATSLNFTVSPRPKPAYWSNCC